MNKKQIEIAKVYAQLAKQLGMYPSRTDLVKADVNRDALRRHFGNMDGLKEKSRKEFPKFFEDIVDPEYFNSEVFNQLKERVKQHKVFFITTAVAGHPIDQDALDAVDTFTTKRKGMSLFLAANYALYDMPADFVAERNIVFRDIKLNSNLSISCIKIDPKQVDPVLGLDVFAQREGTTLIGSPKQRMRPIANSNTKIPHILQATGAITKPRYIPRTGVALRRDTLATKQHVMGGIVVELVDDKFYHFRQVQFDKDGSFIDLFTRYNPDGTTEFVPAEAVVQGDFHDGETDPTADAVADELCRLGKAKYRIMHDTFNGHSISHHDKKKKVLQAIKAKAGKLSLATELHNLKLSLANKVKQAEQTNTQIIFAKSNHDEFLARYLDEGEFDDHNRLVSTELQVAMMKGQDPLQAALASLGLKSDRLRFLSRDEDFKVSSRKIEVGAHGDLGANGSRGGAVGMLRAYGDCTYGHCHFPEILHGAMSAGTSSYLKLDYNRGPSSWMHAHVVVYPNGSRQIIISIGGRYRL